MSRTFLSSPEDDVVGGTDELRRKILGIFYSFNKEVGQDKPWLGPPPPTLTSTTTTTTPSTLTSREKPSIDDQRVAVVEPDEALDLL